DREVEGPHLVSPAEQRRGRGGHLQGLVTELVGGDGEDSHGSDATGPACGSATIRRASERGSSSVGSGSTMVMSRWAWARRRASSPSPGVSARAKRKPR